MRKRIIIFLAIIFASLTTLKAQDYLYDVSFGMGLSSSYGDINQWKFFYSPQASFECGFSYHKNLRWSYNVDFISAGLKGDSRDFSNKYPDGANYDYKSRLWQLEGSADFNFYNYGVGQEYRNLKRFTPFISLGVGLGGVSGTGSGFSFAIPIGAGIKYKLAPRLGLQMKFVFAKTFNDMADGLQDPYKIESSAIKNTDWYSNLSISISYEFGERKIKCNNSD